jgi:Zn-dependent M28 family amino/carboxypeptidase
VSRYLYKKKSKKTANKFDKEVTMNFSIKSNRVKKVSSNVAAKIEGSDPNAPWIVLTAHYDHEGVRGDNIYNGADDNASGTAAVMAIAKAFKKAQEAGEVFTNNVLFLLVSGEEKGLLGSKYYVSDPLIPLDNTMCNLNIDMIGRTDKQHKLGDHYVYIIGSDRISTELHSVNESMNDLYMGLDLDYTYNALDDPNKFYERSDHYNFAKNGIPIIFYYNGTHEDYHKPTDTEDKIEYHLLVDRARLVFHTAWYLAKSEARMLN